jgi:uncharacterized protein YidB (DUF937 family)
MLDTLLAGALQAMLGDGRNQDPLQQILGALLSDREGGGLSGLLRQFQQAASWIGRGENMPVSIEQLMQVFGADSMRRMAAGAGLDERQFGRRLAEVLPNAVDQLTPEGEIPAGGVEDALGMLSKLMPR